MTPLEIARASLPLAGRSYCWACGGEGCLAYAMPVVEGDPTPAYVKVFPCMYCKERKEGEERIRAAFEAERKLREI